MTEAFFKRIVKSCGVDDYWADRLWKVRDESIETAPEDAATEEILRQRCEEDWVYYQDWHSR